jgi:hypothetical protein
MSEQWTYDLLTASDRELEWAEHLMESGLGIAEVASGPGGRLRTITHRRITDAHKRRFLELYGGGNDARDVALR